MKVGDRVTIRKGADAMYEKFIGSNGTIMEHTSSGNWFVHIDGPGDGQMLFRSDELVPLREEEVIVTPRSLTGDEHRLIARGLWSHLRGLREKLEVVQKAGVPLTTQLGITDEITATQKLLQKWGRDR